MRANHAAGSILAPPRSMEIAASLERHLNAIDERVGRLAAKVHELAREGDGTSIDKRAFRILSEIQAAVASLDLAEVLDLAVRVAERDGRRQS